MATVFDSNQAWKQASSAIAANREVVLALAGVFFLLPGLALALFYPPPEPAAGGNPEPMLEAMQAYYMAVLPVMVPMVLFQAAGTLSLLTLLTDRSRPTVREAIGKGLQGIIPYILAQLLLGLGIGLVGGSVLALASLTGSAVLGAVGVGMVAALFVYVAVKTSLSGPVIAVEGERNPVAALKRSWLLTQGNSVRIALFYLLVGVAFIVVITIAQALIGIALALFAGAQALQVAMAVVSSTFNAVLALYFVALIAAVHRQLAGPSPQEQSAPFE